jgi:hypothetical protein
MLNAIEQRFPTIWIKLAKAGIILGLLLTGAMLGRLAVQFRRLEILLIAGVLPLAAVLLLRHGQLAHAILGIVVTAALVRFTLSTGTESRIVMSLIATAGVVVWWFLKMLVHDRRFRLAPAPTNVPLLGFIITCFVSYLWSNIFRDPLVVIWDTWPLVQLGGLGVMVLLPFAFLVTSNHFQQTKWIIWLTVIILAVGTIAIAGYYLHIPVSFLQVRPLFPTWCMTLAYALALFDRRLPWWGRLALLALTGAWFYRVFVHRFRWLSAWMPSLSALGIVSLLRSREFLIVLLVLFSVFAFASQDEILNQIYAERIESGETRIRAYLNNWRVTGKHFLFGVGPAGYAVYYMTYFPTEAMASHSTYIDILSQTGIVGLGFFLWFFAALFKVGWRLWHRTRGRADFPEAFTVAAIGGYVGTILAMALGDWIVPFVYTQTIAGFDYAVYTWILLGAALALYHIVSNPEEPDE